LNGTITRLETQTFRVDLVKLSKELKGPWRGLLPSSEPLEVDPFLIGHAVRKVMLRCNTKDVHGRRLAWNEYKIFLSNQDRQNLKVLEDELKSGLDTLVRKTLSEMQAEMVGDPLVSILIDEANSVARGTAEISVDFVKNFQMKPIEQGELTVRLQHGVDLSSLSAQGGAAGIPSPSVFSGVSQTPPPGAIRLCWDHHEVAIPAGQKVIVGRPHDGAPANFVGLEGANNRISSLHLAVENGATGVMISRPSKANPLEVDGRPVQRGGKRLVERLPAELKLSNGEMVLRLLPRGGD